MKKIIGAGMLVSVASGCHTMEHIENVGEGYSNGNYISSSFMLALTPLMLVPDVFTFGGLMDADQSAEVWTGAATQYSQYESAQQQSALQLQQKQQAALLQQQAQAAAEAARQQEWSKQNQRAWVAQQAQEGQGSSAIVIKGGVPSQNDSSKSAGAVVAAQEIVRGEALRAGYLTSGYGYFVDVKNSGNVKISCLVHIDYRYPRNGTLTSDRYTANTGLIAVGSAATAKFESGSVFGPAPVKVDSYKVSCSKWPFA